MRRSDPLWHQIADECAAAKTATALLGVYRQGVRTLQAVQFGVFRDFALNTLLKVNETWKCDDKTKPDDSRV